MPLYCFKIFSGDEMLTVPVTVEFESASEACRYASEASFAIAKADIVSGGADPRLLLISEIGEVIEEFKIPENSSEADEAS